LHGVCFRCQAKLNSSCGFVREKNFQTLHDLEGRFALSENWHNPLFQTQSRIENVNCEHENYLPIGALEVVPIS
jgi:hypothetical protein